jgi:hypothetical protein
MLPGLFSRELAAELLLVGEMVVGEADALYGLRSRRPLARAGLEPFQTIAWGEQLAFVAHRLINRARLTDAEIPTRYLDDLVWSKEPGAMRTRYHQDSSTEEADRAGRLNFWIALNEVTPEMGAMRFVSGSHREGALGITGQSVPDDFPDEFLDPDGHPDAAKLAELDPERVAELFKDDLLEHYPKLLDLYQLSPPFHYQPGDATGHHGRMVHGAPPNSTDRQRWCYIVEYSAADTRYRNGVYGVYGGYAPGTPLGDEGSYPFVYPPKAAR